MIPTQIFQGIGLKQITLIITRQQPGLSRLPLRLMTTHSWLRAALKPLNHRHLKVCSTIAIFLDLWVTDEGIVYSDFNKDTMIVDSAPNNLTYYVGVDWEVEHKNSIVVFGDNDQQNTYLLEAYVGKY
ncbi:hypothetical protein F5ESL0260_03815 [Lactobacillus sp. ESL0260]|uniref:hypothetical protein n=1 Tax=Lactobacillus sp. ESL0260 TaxID=2069347 RepID=UPI000EFB105E|nr:hypothetical protein [Lactobacillus sp. ESL0260]RMC57949.1 hypothetical protein F5ESL0260_03815 [Lactobacillus sp. ESL0260]